MLTLEPTPLTGAFIVKPRRIGDDRGFFERLFCAQTFGDHGLVATVAQVNHSRSAREGTIRGLHYQLPPAAEAKVVACIAGGIFDVIVDVRGGSPTFLQWFGATLSPENGTMIYVPPGFAHGVQTLKLDSEIVYTTSAPHAPEFERGVRYDDPRVGIRWPLAPTALSDKDLALPLLDAVFRGVCVP